MSYMRNEIFFVRILKNGSTLYRMDMLQYDELYLSFDILDSLSLYIKLIQIIEKEKYPCKKIFIGTN